MRKIKQLVWKNNITDIGKKSGLFEIVSYVDELDLNFSIRNCYHCGDIPDITGKCYLWAGDYPSIMCETVEEAKEMAQEHFESIVYRAFFDEDDKLSAFILEQVEKQTPELYDWQNGYQWVPWIEFKTDWIYCDDCRNYVEGECHCNELKK